jgi:hypothetical protein
MKPRRGDKIQAGVHLITLSLFIGECPQDEGVLIKYFLSDKNKLRRSDISQAGVKTPVKWYNK